MAIGYDKAQCEQFASDITALFAVVETKFAEAIGKIKAIASDEVLGDCDYRNTLEEETIANLNEFSAVLQETIAAKTSTINSVLETAGVAINKNVMNVQEANSFIAKEKAAMENEA